MGGLLSLAGEDKRTGDLFGNKNLLARASKLVGGLKGVDNVYTQHQPLLVTTLDSILKGKERQTDYPYVGPALPAKVTPQDVVVYVAGGATYEESRAVFQLQAPGRRITLVSDSMLNSASFLAALERTMPSQQPR